LKSRKEDGNGLDTCSETMNSATTWSFKDNMRNNKNKHWCRKCGKYQKRQGRQCCQER